MLGEGQGKQTNVNTERKVKEKESGGREGEKQKHSGDKE